MKRMIPVLALFVLGAMSIIWMAGAEPPCDNTKSAPNLMPLCQNQTFVACQGPFVGGAFPCLPGKSFINVMPHYVCQPNINPNDPFPTSPDCRAPGSNDNGYIYCGDAYTIRWQGIPPIPMIIPVMDPCYDEAPCVLNPDDGTCVAGVFIRLQTQRKTHLCCILPYNALISGGVPPPGVAAP